MPANLFPGRLLLEIFLIRVVLLGIQLFMGGILFGFCCFGLGITWVCTKICVRDDFTVLFMMCRY